ncbi:aspartic peptidase domain-containing protein, partial [Echria macrotheca]
MVALASSEPESNPAIRFPSRAERQFQAEQQNSQVLRMPLRRRPPTRVMVPAREDVEERRTRAEPSSTTATATGPNPHPTPNKSNLTAMFQDVAYGIKIWIGTPEQSVILDFDTGSSETWVDPPCTMMEGSGAYEELCRSLGSYIPIASQDGKSVNDTCGPGWISYGSGATYVTYFRDTVTFFVDPFDVSGVGNHFKLSKPVQFGVATWAEGMVSGIFGAAYGVGYNQNYSSFIDEIYNQGLVLDKDFSVSLGSVGEEEAGEVVFGGIDLKKFVGPLQGIPLSSQLSRQADGYYRYWINVTAISVTRPGSCLSVPVTNSSFSERFLPDTGTTMTYLPEEVFYNLLSYFPDAEPVPSYGYVLNCAHLYDEGGYVSFTFDGITIHVPWNQFIFQVPPIFRDEKDVICILGAVPTDAFFILGDTFLRGAYALFRQQEHKVYLAQYSDCGTHVVSSHG